MPTVLTTCPFCACGCGVYLQKEGGKLIGVAPSKNHAVSRGKLCARGWSAHEALLWGERLTVPMIRHSGVLKPATWGDAIALVVTRLSELRNAGQEIGVLGSPRATNEENYLAGKLARSGLGTRNLDFCARGAYQPLIEGIAQVIGGPPPLATLDDIEASDFIFLMEGDLSRTHPRAAASVMEAIKKGAALVTLGPVKTQMGRLAKVCLYTGGSQSEVINELLAAAANLHKDQHSAAERYRGYDALRAKAAGFGILSKQVREAAELLAKAKKAVFLLSPTAASPEQSRKDAAALTSLAAVAGHLDRPGSGFMVLADRSNFFGAWQMGVAPASMPGFELPAHEERKRTSIRPGSTPASGPGLDAAAMMGSIGGLIVLADDPASALPGGEASLAAMKKMTCVVVLDSFNTATAQIAEVVLPIASFAEAEGTYTNLEGRVQRVRAAGEPPGEARQGWQVLTELLVRLGVAAAPPRSATAVFQEIALGIPAYSTITHELLDTNGGRRAVMALTKAEANLQMTEALRLANQQYPKVLIRSGAFDWGSDPLVSLSPTLSRDFYSKRKLFPQGLVEMAKQDADEIGVRQGWKVKLSSTRGEVALPVSIRTDLEPGIVLLPFAFRDCAAKVTGGESAIAIKIDRT